MITNKEKKLIKTMFEKLDYSCQNRGWTNPIQTIYKMELAGEKQHRGFAPAGCGCGNCTISDAAKYFTIKHILDGKESNLPASDIFHIRLECYYGEAIAKEYEKEVNSALTQEEITEFQKLDYVKLVSDEE
jgi:hypothetical protein